MGCFCPGIAHALSWTVNITDPEIVIIGGSVLKSSDLYWDKAEWLFRKFICRSADRHITLLPAALGRQCRFIVAAALILKITRNYEKTLFILLICNMLFVNAQSLELEN